jgi:hypothetical protein
MQLTRNVLWVVGLSLCSAIALAYNGDPPEARTGAPSVGSMPAEGLCLDCHDGASVNSGGSITLLGLPPRYSPGGTYTLTVRLASTETASDTGRRWGFQLTAAKSLDGSGTGTFANVAGQGTMIADGIGSFSTRRYVQVDTSNYPGDVSPVEWQVQWTAPSPGVGAVQFFFSGVAANGSSGNGGDYVYKGSVGLDEDVTALAPVTWGDVKARYGS